MDVVDSQTNVVSLGLKPKSTEGPELTVVDNWTECRHGRFLVDEKLAEVECGICHAKLSPMWVLNKIAQDDSQLRTDHLRMKATIKIIREKIDKRTRCKCNHCGKMTNIKVDISDYEVFEAASKIDV